MPLPFLIKTAQGEEDQPFLQLNTVTQNPPDQQNQHENQQIAKQEYLEAIADLTPSHVITRDAQVEPQAQANNFQHEESEESSIQLDEF